MRFAACLKKDIRLLTGGGIRSLAFLVLPVLLLFIMFFGMRTAADADGFIKAFPIAVRDNDDTVMSRMLISRLRDVSLFESVLSAGEASDEELAKKGCAAVVTIPKDFFYDLYDMKDTDVVIALNEAKPQEAAMVKSAFSSLMNILEENQRVHYAEAQVRFGELTDEQKQEVYYEYSNAAISDVLGRLNLFELTEVYDSGYDEAKLFFAAGILSMLIMFIPLSMLRSVSEETDAGLSARFAVSGGSMAEALLSKLVIAFVMTAIPAAAVIAILKLGSLNVLIPVLSASFLFSFAFFLFISLLCGRASTAQLVGNLIMLLSLTVGGALYPVTLMPDSVGVLSRFTVPHAILDSLRLVSLGRSSGAVLANTLPWLAAALVLFLLSLPFFRARRR
jgi:ABC-type multidrug transport system permease subunit